MININVNDIILATVICGGVVLGQLTLSGITTPSEITKAVASWVREKRESSLNARLQRLLHVNLRNTNQGCSWRMPVYMG